MFTLSLRSLLANKLRFALTGFAVLLGVSFVSASFILADSLGESFEKLATDIAGGVEFQVRSEDYDFSDPANVPVPLELLDDVKAIPGVERATGAIDDFANAVVTPEGEQVLSAGPPVIVSAFEDSIGTTYAIVDGSAPGDGEIGVDIDTALEYDLEIGEVLTYGTEQLTISSTFEFGENNSSVLGAKLFIVDLETSRRITGFDDSVDTIVGEVSEGFTQDEVAASIAAILPDGFEAITGEQVTEDTQNAFANIVGILGNVLLGFAGVALLVSAFIINNTFNITLGQRIREFGLLRAIGAKGSQIRAAVIAEAIGVGIIATLLGILFGVLVAQLIAGIIDAAGGGLPTISTQIRPRTWLVAGLVGVVVTLLSSVAPAVRAARLTPMQALRDGLQQSETSGRSRLVIGGLAVLAGVALLVRGLLVDTEGTAQLLTFLIGGALLVFLGVSRLAPLFAGPLAGLLGRPVAVAFGPAGQMARENARRNPQRTASTASALMIGLALVAMTSVVATSLKDSFTSSLNQALTADFIASPAAGAGQGFSALPETVASDLSAVDGMGPVARFRIGGAPVELADGEELSPQIAGLNADSADLLDLDVQGNVSEADLGAGSALALDTWAEENRLQIGDTVTAQFGDAAEPVPLEVIGTYANDTIFGGLVVDLDTFSRIMPPAISGDALVMGQIAEGADADAVAASVEALSDTYPQVNITNQSQFLDDQASQLDQLLVIVNAFLAMAIIIAMLGIANTMALSVFERTREIGLVRAIGMTGRQVRRMVRWESVVITLFGALLGLVLGVFFGWLITVAVPPDVISRMTLPVGQLLLMLLVAAVIGVVAALFPAFRASRLNVLDAIATE